MSKKVYMAIDQYGQTYHGLSKFPRKDLLERLYSTNATKMYIDDKRGNSYHTGYIINGLWLSLYEVTEFRKQVK